MAAAQDTSHWLLLQLLTMKMMNMIMSVMMIMNDDDVHNDEYEVKHDDER